MIECGTDEGRCIKGMQTCENGTWGACEGGLGPELEISDGMELDTVPGMLSAVHYSVARARRLLRHLLSRQSG